ncbi:MAG: sugar ABC transporter permease [Candidatus Omnitrophica bacterium]|nr:sugar ABC transporter permease [Candidatus Omnitrophota bacterium]MBU1134234.1 sugar ABC transporter permease [Candidatus Omnitrophota bacterium]MBU1367181.1 sugar ABC transporter permease [Candidatus Omnitrophota bacterium]MBU1523384.1 sugar ABC transporter permease [Candidatus Omnitrophota bacterium]MBU1811108.1 sugar ABC transporter permease [Candidatus Omnitrophota bacterium]
MRSSFSDQFTNFSFVFPALLIFSIFFIYPFFYTFILSFQSYDLISQPKFVGLANFREVIVGDKDWWPSVYNGAFITFWALTFQNILAFMLALGVDKVIRGNKFYRVVFFILPVLSEIIIGLLMKQLLSSEPVGRGVLNQWLHQLNLGGMACNWLGVERVRLVTALVHCWKGFGWAFVIFLAGLQTIPEQLYEAARIDGAGLWQCFRKITLPLLMPVIALILVLTILGTMQAFAMILALTGGAGGLTEVPVMRVYNHLRGNFAGLACAEGVVLGIILVAVSFTMFFISKKIKEKYGVLPS